MTFRFDGSAAKLLSGAQPYAVLRSQPKSVVHQYIPSYDVYKLDLISRHDFKKIPPRYYFECARAKELQANIVAAQIELAKQVPSSTKNQAVSELRHRYEQLHQASHTAKQLGIARRPAIHHWLITNFPKGRREAALWGITLVAFTVSLSWIPEIFQIYTDYIDNGYSIHKNDKSKKSLS